MSLNKINYYFLFFIIVFYAISAPFTMNGLEPKNWNTRISNLDSKLEELRTRENQAFTAIVKNKLYTIKYNIDKKLSHRLVIWNVSSKKILNNFIIGYGIASSRKFGEIEKIELSETLRSSGKKHKEIFPSIPLHTHNNTLQIWLELGLIGILLFYLPFIKLWHKFIFINSISRKNIHFFFFYSCNIHN